MKRDLAGNVLIAGIGAEAGAVDFGAACVGKMVGLGRGVQDDAWGAGVGSQRVEAPVQAGVRVHQGDAELAEAVRGVVGGAIEGRCAAGAEDALAAGVEDVGGREKAAYAGEAIGAPFELVVGLEGKTVAECGARDNLGDREEELAGFGQGCAQGFYFVDRCLRGGNAVAGEQQALAP